MERTLILLAALAFAPGAAMAVPLPPAGDAIADVYLELKKEPLLPVLHAGIRYELVNDRYEPFHTRKEAKHTAQYVRRIAPDARGWSVQVMTLDGTLVMDGHSLDLEGTLYDGPFTYYDGYGRLRAEGVYDRGLKTGTWTRYAATGERLTDRTYYAEDWDAMQVRVGVASMSVEADTGTAGR